MPSAFPFPNGVLHPLKWTVPVSERETLAHVTGDDAPAVPDAPTIPTVAAIDITSATAATKIFRVSPPCWICTHLRCVEARLTVSGSASVHTAETSRRSQTCNPSAVASLDPSGYPQNAKTPPSEATSQ